MVYFILGLTVIFLFFFCLFLTIKNQKMSNKIKELKYTIEVKDITKNNSLFNTNKIPINKISTEIEDALQVKKDKSKEINKDKIIFPDNSYKKDVLKKIPKNLSPINLDRDNKEVEKGEDVTMIREESFTNLNDFIKKNNILEKDDKVVNDNISFLESISKQMEEQIEPQTIELTDYEKEQEEHAIISYKEFLKVKDNLYEINAAKENEEFLKDLKTFRNNLK